MKHEIEGTAPGCGRMSSLAEGAAAHYDDPRRALTEPSAVRTRSAGWRAVAGPLLAAVALVWCSADSALALAPVQTVRARIQAVAPPQAEFVLEATLPVPAGTVFHNSGNVPLAIAGVGQVYSTQLEIVSRYPHPSQGADVVELIARVRRPPGASPGDDITFDVVETNQTPVGFLATSDVRSLLLGPRGLVVTARDPFGNFYSADLAEKIRNQDVTMIRDGEHLGEQRSHTVMLPASNSLTGAQAPYPHLCGIHSFVRTYSGEDFVILDLLVHNGMSGREPGPEDDPVHDLYFNQLDLQLPPGWLMGWAFDNPSIGRVNPSGIGTSTAILEPLPHGQFHVLPQQSQFVRRLVLAKGPAALARGSAVLRRETRGFCAPGPRPSAASPNPSDDLWSWWNAATARFLTTNDRLPHLDHIPRANVIASIQSEFDRFAGQVATGAPGGYPTPFRQLGWAQPWGVQYGGMTGGDEIEMHPEIDTAWARHPIGVRWMELRSRAYIDRHPVALFDAAGRPPILEEHLQQAGSADPFMPFNFFLKPRDNYFGFESADLRVAEYAYMTGVLPFYQKDIEDFQAIDFQHYTRFLNPHLGLVWIANDAVAKLQLELSANLFQLSFHQYPNNQWGYVSGVGLLDRILKVAANPGQGADFGRGPAWGLVAATAHYATADQATRVRLRPWFTTVARTAREGQSICTGNPSALKIGRNFKGVYQSRPCREVGFFLNAAEAMRTTVFEGLDPSTANTLRSYVVDGAYSSTMAPYWSNDLNGQLSLIAVRPTANELPEFCLNVPENGYPSNFFIDRTSALPSWAYAFDATQDGLFLQRATSSVQHPNLTIGLESMGLHLLHEMAPMLSKLQEL